MSDIIDTYKPILRRSKYVFMLMYMSTNEVCDFDIYADSEPEAWLTLTSQLGLALSAQTIIVNNVYKLNSIRTTKSHAS